MFRYSLARTFLLTLVMLGMAGELSGAFGQISARPFPESNPQNWKEFKSGAGQFSVFMPGVPADENLAKYDNVVMHLFNLRTNAEYAVGYADYSEVWEGTDQINAFMYRVQAGGVIGIGGTLLESKDSQFEGHPGRVYKVEFVGGYLMNSKIVVVKNRLYLIAASTYGRKAPANIAQIYEAAAQRFLNSFKLTADKANGPVGEVDALMTGPLGKPIIKACLPPREFCQADEILFTRLRPRNLSTRILRGPHTSGGLSLSE